MRSFRSAAVIVGGLILSFSGARAGILIPVPPFPGSTATYIRAINDKNVITGYYTMADGLPHGFVGTLNGKYTSFDASESGTIPLGIANDGYITIGSNLRIDCPVSGCGFVRAPDGTISQVHKGKNMLDAVVQGILNRSRFVGDYGTDGTPGAPNLHPQFYGFYGRGDKYRASLTLPFPTTQTRPRGINRAGTVVGFYSEAGSGTFPGFVLQDGVATSITYPDDNAWQVYLEAVNDNGLVAGSWVDYALVAEHAFVYDIGRKAFSPIAIRHAGYVLANGINNAGVVALSADDTSYIYCTKKSACPAHGAGSVELPDEWIPAPAGRVHSVICRDFCLRP
jgi:hypothetical protein